MQSWTALSDSLRLVSLLGNTTGRYGRMNLLLMNEPIPGERLYRLRKNRNTSGHQWTIVTRTDNNGTTTTCDFTAALSPATILIAYSTQDYIKAE